MNPLDAKVISRGARVLSIDTCRQQCEVVAIDDEDSDGIGTHPDDALILGMQDAAVDHAERFTGRAIRPGVFEFALDDFPTSRCFGYLRRVAPRLGIEIPRPPLVELLDFGYGEDSEQHLDEGVNYVIDDYGDMATLRPINTWPVIPMAYPNLVKCRYRAGYQSEVDPDSDYTEMPGGIRGAILLTIAHLYENRSASTEKAMAELPLGVEAMLRPWRVRTGMA